jgi:hypothetical protein
VVVKAHEARKCGMARQIDNLSTVRHFHVASLPYCADQFAFDNDRLVVARRRSGTIDQPNVRQRHDGSVYRDYGLKWRSQRPLRAEDEGRCGKQQREETESHGESL